MAAWRSENIRGENHHDHVEPDETVCDECGEVFEHPPSRDRHLCSRECYHSWRRGRFTGENSGSWKEKLQKECSWCGTAFEVIPARESQEFCSKRCAYDYQTTVIGPDNPLWRNGTDIPNAVRHALGPRSWGKTIDEHHETADDECAVCGDTSAENGRRLSVHHIVPVAAGGVHGDWNFMMLCQSCHTKVEAYTEAIPEVRRVLTP